MDRWFTYKLDQRAHARARNQAARQHSEVVDEKR